MTPRARVLTAIDRRKPDRIPIGFDVHGGILDKLFAHFGVNNRMALYEAMGIDGFSVFTDSYVPPKFIGPEPVTLADGSKSDFFGIISQKHWPLAFASSVADLDRYRWPQADWFDYSGIRRRCIDVKAKGIVTVGGEGGCGITHAINLRGYELALIDPMLAPKLTHAYMERMGDFFVEWNERWLSAAGGEFDIYRCGDDMGNCLAMDCSPAVWREFYKPQLARIWAVAKKHGLKIWFHCCGCCRPVLDDLVEMGVDLLDPVPQYVAGSAHRELKRIYGRTLAFVGGVDQPNVLVRGTPRDVEREVKRCIDVLGADGGYIIAGSQVLTDDIPFENVLMMYKTAVEYGRY